MRRLIHFSPMFLALAISTAEAACSRTIRVGWADFPPYVQSGADGSPVGLEVEMARAIFKRAECELEFIPNVPTKRQALYLQMGEIDMQLAASDVKERHAYAWYSLPYRRELMMLFARKGEAKNYPIKHLTDLADRDWNILAPYQGWYGATFNELLPDLRTRHLVYPYVSSSQAMEMLYHGRADLVAGDYYSMRYTAKVENLPEPEALSVPVNDNQVHLIFSKRSVTQADVATINAAIRKLDEEGGLRKIAERYGLGAGLAK